MSPQFHEMDDRASRLLAGSILDDISASDQQSVIGSVAAYCNETDVMDLIASVLKHRQLFAQGSAKGEIWGRLTLPETLTSEALCAGVFTRKQIKLTIMITLRFRSRYFRICNCLIVLFNNVFRIC